MSPEDVRTLQLDVLAALRDLARDVESSRRIRVPEHELRRWAASVEREIEVSAAKVLDAVRELKRVAP